MADYTKTNVNSITGTAGSDLILVGAPADALTGTIDGAGGYDELRFTGTSGATLVLGGNLSNVELVTIGTGSGAVADASGTTAEGIDASALGTAVELRGNAGANALTGGSGNDVLVGGAGNDTLDGGAGDNLMLGGTGDDTYVVDSAGDQVLEFYAGRRASTTSDGSQANNVSQNATLSADGRYVSFESVASNLVAGDTNGAWDIFLKDLVTGVTTRVSTASDGSQSSDTSLNATLSADGRYVMFDSFAGNLVTGDTNGTRDIFVKDIQTGTVTRVSTASDGTQGNNQSYNASFSADGRYVSFESYASNLVAGDTNAQPDIFVKDLQTGVTTRISTASDGTQANGTNGGAAVSTDGRYVTFQSVADNLVAGDNNFFQDVFVKDLQTGVTTRVSTASDGTQANNQSLNAALSADGRYVTFQSTASNLVAGDTNGGWDIFLKDLQTGVTTRVSTASDGTQANSESTNASLSPDGHYVTFESYASNLVAGDTGGLDIFVKDLQTGIVTQLSTSADGTQANNQSNNPTLSADGRYVTFQSVATNLVAGDTNNTQDIFVVPTALAAATGGTDTVLASVDYVLGAGLERLELQGTADLTGTGNDAANTLLGNSGNNTLDGGAGNDTLTGGAGNDSYVVDSTDDVVVENPGAGTDSVLATVSHSLTANVENLTLGGTVGIDATGNALDNVLTGNSGNNALDGGTGNDTLSGGAGDDTYLVDSGGDLVQENSDAGSDSIQSSLNLTLGANVENLLLTGSADLDGTGNELDNQITGNSGNNQLSSLDGNDMLDGGTGNDVLSGGVGNDVILGGTGNDTLDGGAGNDVMLGGAGDDTYVVDATGDQVFEFYPERRASTASDGTQANNQSQNASLSADGRYVMFESAASNLVAGDTNGTWDIFVKDLVTGVTTRISTTGDATQGNSSSQNAMLSAAGRYISFQSAANNLVADDTNNRQDIVVKDLQTGATTLASTASDGTQANSDSYNASISADGRYVTSDSSASNLVAGDTNGTYDIFVKDLQTGSTTRVSTASDGTQANSQSQNATLSTDGRFVAFQSNASNLVAGDTNGQRDIFVKDIQTGVTTRVSTASDGTQADNQSQNAALSADGRYVTFESYASNLVTGDNNGTSDIFLKDLQTGVTTRVSTASDGTQANDVSYNASLSPDGRYVTFESYASNLVAGGSNGLKHIFVKDLQTGAVTQLSTTADGTQANNQSQNAALSTDGRYVTFQSTATNLVAGDTNNTQDIFVVPTALAAATGGTDTVLASVNHVLGAGIERLELQGTGDLAGTGNDAANTLLGNSGNNTLDGGAGNDILTGGTGNDSYVVDSAGDVVVENPGAGTDSVLATVSHSLAANVENLTLGGSAAINATGNALDNILTGNNGNNALDGGAGNDQMSGGAGDDTYLVDSAGDLVQENSGAGSDSVQSSVTTTLSANVENLTLTGSANLDGTGNELDNRIAGNSGNNLLSGLDGNDTLDGEAGNDALTGGVGNDVLAGGAGNDTLDGSTGNDVMLGGTGDDTYVVDSAGDQALELYSQWRTSTNSDGAQANNQSQTASLSADGRYVMFQSNASNLVTGDTNGTSDIFLKDLLTGVTTRVSTASDGTQASSDSYNASFSADGRYVTFDSYANNLVAGDFNYSNDIFLKDLQTGATTRVSTASDGTQGNSTSQNAALSADGRYVTFESYANNLVAGDTNGQRDIFVKDLQTGVTTRISTASNGTQANSQCQNAALSADGRYVSFESYASNLVAGDTNGQLDIFVKELQTGVTMRVSAASDGTQANNSSQNAALSADGRYVTFESYASNLVAGDTNGQSDIFVKDLQTGVTTRVSTASDGTQANSASYNASLSPDGRYVTFASAASNLVAGDTNGQSDIFVKDLQTGAVTQLSIAADGTQANNQSNNPTLSADGRYVTFQSTATNLVAGDTNNTQDIFVVPTALAAAMGGTDTVLASVNHVLGAGIERLELQGTGDLIGTGNNAANTLVGNGGNNTLDGGAGNDTLTGGTGNDSYVVDSAGDVVMENPGAGTDSIYSSVSLSLGTNLENLTLTGSANINGTGNELDNRITGNAGANALAGAAGNDVLVGGAGHDTLDGGAGNDTMAGGDGNDIYVVDAVGDQVLEVYPQQRASTAGDGTEANADSFKSALSADGRYVSFESTANNLVAGDTNDQQDIFVKDLLTGAVTRASTAGDGTQGNNSSFNAGLSADGRYVTFQSNASNLLAGDTNGNTDIFVKDLQTGAVTRVSTAADGTQANGDSLDAAVSTDGRYVSFESYANNLVAGDIYGYRDIFVKDLQTGTVTRASTAADGTEGNSNSLNAALSADGRYVIFESGANNLVAGDTNGTIDIFVKDLQTGAITRVSTASDGTEANGDSLNAALSADGRYVAFQSPASNLVAGDTNGQPDIFVKDLQTGVTTRVSTAADGTQGNGDNFGAALSADGRYVTFASDANNLVAGDTNGTYDIFVKDLLTGATTRISIASDGTQGNNSSQNTALSADGRYVTFVSYASNLVAGDTNGQPDIFVVPTAPAGATGGNDTVRASVNYVLGAGLERLELQGTSNLTGTGNELDNHITGNTGNNLLSGLDGNDTLDGGSGNDTMIGGTGNDFYYVDALGDVVSELPGAGTDTVISALSAYTLGSNLENLAFGGSGDNTGTGNTVANLITGNAGNDTLDGREGADTLIGGAGNDSYLVDNSGDAITENNGEGNDSVQSSVSYTLSANVENLVLTGSANIDGTGTAQSDTITGNSGRNALSGLGGDDTLNGNAGNDVLNGGAGNDTLDGGIGNDIMAGGSGDDTYIVNTVRDVVRENANEGIDTVISAVTYNLAWSEVENVTLTGTAALRATGNTFNNVLTGNTGSNILDGGLGHDSLYGGAGNDSLIGRAGNDLLDGGAGTDVLNGGAGSDTYVVDSVTDVVTEAGPATDIDTVRSTVTWTLGANLEILIQEGTGNVNGTGNALDNSIYGNAGNNLLNGLAGNDYIQGGAGNDTLDGSTGADVLIGGSGNDTYVVDGDEDSVTELVDEGTDTLVIAYANATTDPQAIGLPGNFENITVTGTGLYDLIGGLTANVLTGNASVNALFGFEDDDTLIGGAGNDYLDGGDGDDMLDGGLGIDQMEGGAGDDTYTVDVAGDLIIEGADGGTDTVKVAFAAAATYTLATDLEHATVTSAAAINLTGNALANILTGNAAANILNGLGGADTLIGGLGGDTYVVDDAGDVIIETSALATEIDTVQASVSFTLGANLERLTLTGTDSLNGTGNALANTIAGNGGNNVLDGGAGKDTLIGGLGNDTYVVDGSSVATWDTVTELAGVGTGTDTVNFTGSGTYTLQVNVENLTLLEAAGASNGTGNAADNVLTGNSAANVLNGAAGNDTLAGDAGNDTLIGGAGNDMLTGGADADFFVFNLAAGATNRDTVTDFVSGTDVLRFDNAVFTAIGPDGALNVAAFISGAALTGGVDASDRVVYNTTTGALYYDADGSGAGAAVQVALLDGFPGLAATDIFVM